MNSSRERQVFCPAESPSGTLNETLCLYFNLNGHYDALKPVAIPSPFLSDQNWHRHNAFLRDTDQRASRQKRGREMSSASVVPPPKKRARAPRRFTTKPRKDRQHDLLTWLLGEDCAVRAMDGEIMDGGSLSPPPALIPTKIIDEKVNLTEIREFFSREAWSVLQKLLAEKDKDGLWQCPTCSKDIQNGETSIWCESCLEWSHLQCVSLQRAPKRRHWFCPACNT